MRTSQTDAGIVKVTPERIKVYITEYDDKAGGCVCPAGTYGAACASECPGGKGDTACGIGADPESPQRGYCFDGADA